MAEFICRVSADDRIVFVDDEWTRFAIENGAAHLAGDRVMGTLLWDHLSDITTRHLYRIFMHRVREGGISIELPFRCDAPDRRRFMRMRIQPLPDSGVEFRSELLHEELRTKVDLLDVRYPRREDFVMMCSWCKRVQAPDWVEVEEGVVRLKLFDVDKLPWVSHGICPDCERGMEEEIRRLTRLS